MSFKYRSSLKLTVRPKKLVIKRKFSPVGRGSRQTGEQTPPAKRNGCSAGVLKKFGSDGYDYSLLSASIGLSLEAR